MAGARGGGSTKTWLRNAFILVRCSKRRHDDCRRIRDTLVDGTSGYVQTAYTTDAVVRGTRYCVAASALVPAEEAGRFKRRLSRIRAGGGRPVTVERYHVIVDERDDLS